jgi:hypothetical protein
MYVVEVERGWRQAIGISAPLMRLRSGCSQGNGQGNERGDIAVSYPIAPTRDDQSRL